MTHWLQYNLRHPLALSVLLAMVPVTLINFAAQRKRKQGVPPPYVSGWQTVVLILVLIGLCIVGVFAKLG